MCLGSLLFTGVLNLVAVSYDRLTAIVAPLEARLTVHGAHIVMASTWVTGVILGLPLIFFRIYRVRIRTKSYGKDFEPQHGDSASKMCIFCSVEGDNLFSIKNLVHC
jgi:hypothetical protein